MQVIDWKALNPGEAEVSRLLQIDRAVIPARKLRQQLVLAVLEQYPWTGRHDLAECYHPTRNYQPGEWLVLFHRSKKDDLRMPVWELRQVAEVVEAENPHQGRFQVISILENKKKLQLVAGVANGPAESGGLNLDQLEPEDLEELASRIADAYSKPLQTALERLVAEGMLPGRFVNNNYIHIQALAIDPRELIPYFERLTTHNPFLTVPDLLPALQPHPELHGVPRDDRLAMLRLSLSKSDFLNLGADRWTTPALFEQFNREVLRGLPVPRVRSKIDLWTLADQQDLALIDPVQLPDEIRHELELEEPPEPAPADEELDWMPPTGPVRLPTLSYLYVTQGYFPIWELLRAFHPEVRLVMIQVIDGEYQSFVVDRHGGALKAVNIETFRQSLLEAWLPAGTHLWLEYQAQDRYRVTPRPLPSPRQVTCKLARMENGKLCIEQAEIPMGYEGDPAIFMADLRFSDIEALFAEAHQTQLSVRDAIIQAVQELCAADPQGKAYWRDIFNLVYLKRMCSLSSVRQLLYSTPNFIKAGEGFFQYASNPSEAEHQPQPAIRRRPVTTPGTQTRRRPVSKRPKRKAGRLTLDKIQYLPSPPDPTAPTEPVFEAIDLTELLFPPEAGSPKFPGIKLDEHHEPGPIAYPEPTTIPGANPAESVFEPEISSGDALEPVNGPLPHVEPQEIEPGEALTTAPPPESDPLPLSTSSHGENTPIEDDAMVLGMSKEPVLNITPDGQPINVPAGAHMGEPIPDSSETITTIEPDEAVAVANESILINDQAYVPAPDSTLPEPPVELGLEEVQPPGVGMAVVAAISAPAEPATPPILVTPGSKAPAAKAKPKPARANRAHKRRSTPPVTQLWLQVGHSILTFWRFMWRRNGGRR